MSSISAVPTSLIAVISSPEFGECQRNIELTLRAWSVPDGLVSRVLIEEPFTTRIEMKRALTTESIETVYGAKSVAPTTDRRLIPVLAEYVPENDVLTTSLEDGLPITGDGVTMTLPLCQMLAD